MTISKEQITEDHQTNSSPAQDLIEKYEALTKHAGKILYPKSNMVTESWPDTVGWNKFKKLCFYFDKPFFPAITHSPDYSPILTVFLRIFSIFSLVAFVVIISIGQLSIDSNSTVTVSPIKNYILLFFLIVNLTVAIGNTVLFIPNKKDEKRSEYIFERLVLPSAIFIIALLFDTAPEFSIWKWSNLLLIPLYFPGYIVMCVNFPVAFQWVVGTIQNWVTATRSFHSPQQTMKVKELVAEMNIIDGGLINQEFLLSDLTSIKEWASANQDTSEKRLNPLLILLAFFALFTGSDWFMQQIHKMGVIITEFLNNSSDLANWWPFMGLTIILFVIMLFVYQILLIFQNISIQSLIVEACIVAEYSVKANESKSKNDQVEIPCKPTFFQKVKNCFCKK